MKWLLRLYPRAWRDRYQAEMEALLESKRYGWGGGVDLLRGALDAHLLVSRAGSWPSPRSFGLLVGVGVVALLALGAVPQAVEGSLPGRLPYINPPGTHFGFSPLVFVTTGLWAAGALIGRRLGAPLPAWFCGLFALSGPIFVIELFAFDWLGPANVAAQMAFPAAVWVGVGTVLLRRTGATWAIAAVIATGVHLLLGDAPSLMSALWESLFRALFPGPVVDVDSPKWWLLLTVSALHGALWASVLAFLLSRRRGRPRWGLGGGAGVSAGPAPDSPQIAATIPNR